jgi:hypothetical protein
MNKILQEIRSVQGVTGVLILDKREKITYQLTPASFSSEGLKEIGLRLSRLVRLAPSDISMELRFENGIAFLYNLERATVFIFGRLGLNQSILELVLKSAFFSIERELSKTEGKAHLKKEKKSSFILDKVYLEYLLQALNQIAKIYKQRLGIYLATQNLRKSKEEFLQRFSLLHSFFVDNNGVVSLIRGKEEEIPSDSVKAFALWISFFLQLCSSQDPELSTDIKELTLDLEEKLEQMGFYETYEELRRT